MQRDYLSNPVGALHESTLRGIDDFIEGYLAYETRAERILAAAHAEPESCMANVYSGLLWMLLEAPAGAPGAPKYYAAADAEPESCMANVYSGLLWMLLEAPAGAQRAAKYLAAAERAAPHATRREQ